MNRKTDNEKLLAWAIDKIKNEYRDDISLLIGYDPDSGHDNIEKGAYQYYKSPFDYFVPATDRGLALAKTFIIDGIGYDLYPRSWARIEAMADLTDNHPACLGEGKILYCRSAEDENRFLASKERLQNNLSRPDFVYQRALEKLKVATELYQTALFSDELYEVRMAAGYIAYFLGEGVAFMNGTYIKEGQSNLIQELKLLDKLPYDFLSCYEKVIRADTIPEITGLCHQIIKTVRGFMADNKPFLKQVPKEGYGDLTGWYEELSFTWQRIYRQCRGKNGKKAFAWGCFLQNELNIVKEEFNLEPMDLMGSFDAGNLGAFQKQAEKLEKYILDTIQQIGRPINTYGSVADFIARNQ